MRASKDLESLKYEKVLVRGVQASKATKPQNN